MARRLHDTVTITSLVYILLTLSLQKRRAIGSDEDCELGAMPMRSGASDRGFPVLNSGAYFPANSGLMEFQQFKVVNDNYFGRSGSGVIVVCNCRSCNCRPCASLVL